MLRQGFRGLTNHDSAIDRPSSLPHPVRHRQPAGSRSQRDFAVSHGHAYGCTALQAKPQHVTHGRGTPSASGCAYGELLQAEPCSTSSSSTTRHAPSHTADPRPHPTLHLDSPVDGCPAAAPDHHTATGPGPPHHHPRWGGLQDPQAALQTASHVTLDRAGQITLDHVHSWASVPTTVNGAVNGHAGAGVQEAPVASSSTSPAVPTLTPTDPHSTPTPNAHQPHLPSQPGAFAQPELHPSSRPPPDPNTDPNTAPDDPRGIRVTTPATTSGRAPSPPPYPSRPTHTTTPYPHSPHAPPPRRPATDPTLFVIDSILATPPDPTNEPSRHAFSALLELAIDDAPHPWDRPALVRWLTAYTTACAARLHSLQPEVAVNILYTCARLGVPLGPYFTTLTDHLAPHLLTLNIRKAGLLHAALERLAPQGFTPRLPFLQAFLDRFHREMSQVTKLRLSSVVKLMVQWRVQPDDAVLLQLPALIQGSIQRISPWEGLAMMKALELWGVLPDRKLVHDFSHHLADKLTQFDARTLLDIVEMLVRHRAPVSKLWHVGFYRAAMVRVDQWSGPEALRVLHCLLQIQRPANKQLVVQLVRRGIVGRHLLQPEQVVQLVYCGVALGAHPMRRYADLLKLEQHVNQHLEQLSPSGLAMAVVCMAQLQYPMPPPLLRRCRECVARHLPRMRPTEAVHVLRHLARREGSKGNGGGPEWWVNVTPVVVAGMGELGAREVCSVLGTLAMVGAWVKQEDVSALGGAVMQAARRMDAAGFMLLLRELGALAGRRGAAGWVRELHGRVQAEFVRRHSREGSALGQGRR